MLIEVAEILQKEFDKTVEQKEIKNDLRKLTSKLNIHSSYFRNHNNYKVLKSVKNYLFKQGYYIFERITPLLRFRDYRGTANEIVKYFNNYACIIYKGNLTKQRYQLRNLLLLNSSKHHMNTLQNLKKL
ncbi:9105_t:CDS:1, partial [Racocetra fulgida]